MPDGKLPLSKFKLHDHELIFSKFGQMDGVFILLSSEYRKTFPF